MAQVKMKNPITGQVEIFNEDDWNSNQMIMQKESQGWTKEKDIDPITPGGPVHPVNTNSYINDFGNTGFKKSDFNFETPELNYNKPQDLVNNQVADVGFSNKGQALGNKKRPIDDFFGIDAGANGGHGTTQYGEEQASNIYNPNESGEGQTTISGETIYDNDWTTDFDQTEFYSGEPMNYNTGTQTNSYNPMPPQEEEEY